MLSCVLDDTTTSSSLWLGCLGTDELPSLHSLAMPQTDMLCLVALYLSPGRSPHVAYDTGPVVADARM
jgi:hypothetical protein